MALQDVVQRFPDTEYARDATLKIDLTNDHLAGKEMAVGRYYLRQGDYIGAINRFGSPSKLCGYTGLCPRVHQSGERDHRGSLAKNGPKYLRWAMIEAATHAVCSPVYRER